jgi:glutamine synthetase
MDTDMNAEGHRVVDARRLPLNLLDALRALDASTVLREILGDGFVDSYLKVKMRDWHEHCAVLTDWERRATLNC